ncbi:MAG TPA: DinB family protein [Pyrinomonadaceae bacterium]|jgi:hypothetical protein
MIFNTVADIYAENDAVRGRLVARAEGLSEAQERWRAEAAAWTPAEIVEHLAIIEGNMVRLVTKLLGKAESAAGGTPAPPMPAFSLDEQAARARAQKFVAPEEIRPRGDVPLADSLAGLRASRAALHDLRPRVETADGTRAHYPHPFFGPLDLYQWLAFIGVHEQRHLDQLERLLADAPH